ncbi:nuclease [Peribacillus saganii]|uniref:Nuclease n=2 Tax=Peribacillus saganii TaxID=2303992 RepID=A0A372LNF4_9BACI|nr:nuclease [Peribacillus saganii]
MNGKTEVVRLLLVDTPETKHPAKPVQPFGLEASNFAKATLTRKQVGIEIDISERDNYGRLLAYLWIGDKMFNEMLLEKALARVAYIYPPNTKYVDQFRSIQEKAQKQALGIWSLENYSSEEGFETDGQTAEGPSNESKTPGTGSCKIKGNISSSGEKIYHVSGSQHYDITKAEEMFCTEEEAEAAGYRASKR